MKSSRLSHGASRVVAAILFGGPACSSGGAPGPAMGPDTGGESATVGATLGPKATGDGGDTAGATGDTAATGESPTDAQGVGIRPLRRLDRTEYAFTLESLFGPGLDPGVLFPDDPQGPSSYATPTPIGDVEFGRFESGGMAIAAALRGRVPELAPCPSGSPQAGCVAEFLENYGTKIFRRPLRAPETDLLTALSDKVTAPPLSYGYEDAIRVLLGAMLQSPQFLYHFEQGPEPRALDGDLVALTPYELASRMSYLLWSTMPDEVLFRAAEAGELRTDAPNALEKQARRLLADPRAARVAHRFFGQWVHLDGFGAIVKDLTLFPEFDAALRDAMRVETEAFLERVLRVDGTWESLLLGRRTRVNGKLAALYGISGVTDEAWHEVDLPPERSGLLTQAGFLAVSALPQEGSPVRRGKVVATRFLCRTIPPPPPDVNATPPPIAADVQTRAAYEQHTSNRTCRDCHRNMDPLGFAFEHFDAVGRFRREEAGKPVDATGTVYDLDGKDRTFDGALELAEILAHSDDVRRCAVTQWMRYTLGRKLTDEDDATAGAVFEAFRDSNWDQRELLVALVKSPSFTHRALAEGELP